MVLRQHDVLGRDVAMDEAHRVEVLESVERLDRDLDGEARRHRAVLRDPLLDVRAVDELPDHVVGAVVELGEVVQHRQVLVLDHRGGARFLEEALQPLIVGGDVRPHDLDDAQLVEMDVADLEDLAHAADAEAVEDLVLAVDQPRRVGPLEERDLLAAVRALVELRVDRLFAAQTGDLTHWLLGQYRLGGCESAVRRPNASTAPRTANGLATHNCTPGPLRSARRRPASTSRVRRACCSHRFRWRTSDLRAPARGRSG